MCIVFCTSLFRSRLQARVTRSSRQWSFLTYNFRRNISFLTYLFILNLWSNNANCWNNFTKCFGGWGAGKASNRSTCFSRFIATERRVAAPALQNGLSSNSWRNHQLNDREMQREHWGEREYTVVKKRSKLKRTAEIQTIFVVVVVSLCREWLLLGWTADAEWSRAQMQPKVTSQSMPR